MVGNTRRDAEASGWLIGASGLQWFADVWAGTLLSTATDAALVWCWTLTGNDGTAKLARFEPCDDKAEDGILSELLLSAECKRLAGLTMFDALSTALGRVPIGWTSVKVFDR